MSATSRGTKDRAAGGGAGGAEAEAHGRGERLVHVVRDEVELALLVEVEAVVAGPHPVAVVVDERHVEGHKRQGRGRGGRRGRSRSPWPGRTSRSCRAGRGGTCPSRRGRGSSRWPAPSSRRC